MKGLLAAAIVALLIPAPAAAQTPPDDGSLQLAQRSRGRLDREAMRAATTIAEAAATYKTIIATALRGRPDTVRLQLIQARATLPRLRPVLDDKAYAALESHVTGMEEAHAKDNAVGTALAATEAFKVVVTAIDPAMRRMPPEVALLNYAALKLTVLASAVEIDWPAIQATAKESDKSWIATRRYVRDGNLRVLLAEIQSGLRDAVTRNDAAGVKFAASLQIHSIALLQELFGQMARAMGRAR